MSDRTSDGPADPRRARFPRKLNVWRDSVCAGDDVDASHEITLSNRHRTLASVLNQLSGMGYLALIAGGRATWVLHAAPRPSKPLAVVAQQWSEPRCLVDPSLPVEQFLSSEPGEIDGRPRPHLEWEYLAQTDPESVFERLRNGERISRFDESLSWTGDLR